MKRKEVTDEIRDRVYDLLTIGQMKRSEIASMLNISPSSVFCVESAASAAARKDLDTLKELFRDNKAFEEWACAKFQISVPSDDEPDAENDEEFSGRQSENDAQNGAVNQISAETLNAAIESFSELTQKLMDCINLNSDILLEELRRQTDILNGIKMNTKKKFHQN